MTSSSCKIGIIGRVDPRETMFDGQTVKTRTVHRLLVQRYGSDGVVVVDTLNYRREPLRVLREYVHCLRCCDDIVVLLSRGGRTAFFPHLAHVARRSGKRIYHDLIGGWLARDIERDASGRLVERLNAFAVNWVESRRLAEQLSSLGVTNVAYLPNFKALTPISSPELPAGGGPFRFCMFGRVVREKGVGNAIETIASINADRGRPMATLDVFGPIGEGYRDEFERLLSRHQEVRYCGCVTPERSVDTIKGYSALLFPTEWMLEGIPGTIIDALNAGLPVIASRWQCYSEMLEDGRTGYGYEFGLPGGLKTAILTFAEMDADATLAMRGECLRRAKNYSAEAAFSEMIRVIEGS